MSVYAKLLNSVYTDIQYHHEARSWPDGGVDIELEEMPGGYGPYTLDPKNKKRLIPSSTSIPKPKDLLLEAILSATSLQDLQAKLKAQHV